MTNEEAKNYLASDSCKYCKDLHRSECRGSRDCFESKRLAVLALYKQIPKKPILDMARHRVECSVCHYSVAWYDKKDGGIGGLPYCNICGQKIDWGEEK